NQLTGSNQHVGNFPGVTVDKKSGKIRKHSNTEITDLPGIYSLSPYTGEEIVSRKFILEQKPSAIINIVDATAIERNLYLTMQLMELDVPMVLALNMMDELTRNGGAVLINEMEKRLGIPVIPISARNNRGVAELAEHAIHVAQFQERPSVTDFCDKSENGGAVHRCLHGIMNLIEDHALAAEIPLRFAAAKVVEGDEDVISKLNLSQNEKEMLEHIIVQMEEERGMDRAAAIADMRYAFIQNLCDKTLIRPKESREYQMSRRVDKILTGKFTALPVFILIMALVFYLTFNLIGPFFQDALEGLIGKVTESLDAAFTKWNVSPILHSLVIDGIFEGVGSVLSFIPIVVVLFFFLSLLEDSGYMARVAFFMDSLLRGIGLSGRSIVPMLVGFGCTVPGVMASRTLPSRRDRRMTILLTPFMSCTAKLPIYAFFASAFFPGNSALTMVTLYLGGIVAAIIVATIGRKTVFKGEPVPFVMELPNYRMPGAKNVILLLWDKAKDFLQRAFTVIFIATIAVWLLQNFDLRMNQVENYSESILASVAGLIAPVFSPLGLGDWRIVTALVTGFMAKESVVSTLTVLFGTTEALTAALGPSSAAAMLVFCLLYTPCVAAVAAIRRELGGKWAFSVAFLFQSIIAWIFAFGVKVIFSAIL
ncbi:MAG: ferrous iron transport protein B, partial [Spirochaetaceae bacterium]|nr:ferrous iron transport protein B [Spirochaetaceae bacterium]